MDEFAGHGRCLELVGQRQLCITHAHLKLGYPATYTLIPAQPLNNFHTSSGHLFFRTADESFR
jgi:hypothetical protein